MSQSLKVLAERQGWCDRLIRGAVFVFARIFMRAQFSFSCVAFHVGAFLPCSELVSCIHRPCSRTLILFSSW